MGQVDTVSGILEMSRKKWEKSRHLSCNKIPFTPCIRSDEGVLLYHVSLCSSGAVRISELTLII